MKKTRTAYLHSVLALLVCISMFVGSTFAWFTDNVSSVNNIIKSGNLDLEMYWTDDLATGTWYNVEDPQYNTVFNYDNWEPGYTDVKYIKLVNKGSLALNFELTLTPSGSVGKLAEVISVYYGTDGVALAQRSDLDNLNSIGLLSNVMNGGATAKGSLLAKNEESPLHDSSETIITLAMSMLTTAGNEYQNESIGDGFTITALASQCAYEADSFGTDYDKDASFPKVLNSSKAEVELEDGKIPTGGLTISGGGVSAVLPEDVKLEDGVQKLTVTVTPLEKTTSDITVVNQEILIPVDVHIEGVAEDNTAPIIIDLGEILPKYLNMGNYHLYHVEDGVNNEMTMVDSVAALAAHNQFTYDSDTGAVTVAMATFSEVALVADTANAWNGEEDVVFRGEGTAENPYIISSADELAGLSTLVSIENATYGGAHYRLISNLDMNGVHTRDTDDKQTVFYPIGYRVPGVGANAAGETEWYRFSNSYFSGTFDGNGHTIGNIYQNTWLMDGDYDNGYWDDAMGIFGRVRGTSANPAVIKNLRVDRFESDGEYTTTGCVATYADNAIFENIAVVNSNPRVYHIGNGGIVGCGGWWDRKNGGSLLFRNITVDNTNKISALWGNWGTSCAGIMGQWYGSSEGADYTVHFENCHTAAQIDANNDVCGNYQWYWYRYAGMVIGSIRLNETCEDGYIRPNMKGITASGCTVHFGDWNNYWYCELVANSIASYTHDHQFSRLTRVDAVDVENKTYTVNGQTTAIPSSGRVNYVVVTKPYSTENATCYHFVDGEVWNHEDAGTEIVDVDKDGVKEEVLKEDRQHYYLPFNQVFQGYGDGIMNIPLVSEKENLNEIYPGLDITILDNQQSAESEEKFAVNGQIKTVSAGKTYNVGDLFVATGMGTIKSDKVQVTVSPADEDSTASGTYVANASDWTKGTLTFSGTGAVTITITDYYFCTPCTIRSVLIEGSLDNDIVNPWS